MRGLLPCLALSGAAFLGCGAKTGLLLPDVPQDADVVDARDALDAPDLVDLPDVCVPPVQPVERLSAEVIFVIDRSRSMTDPTPGGVSRWSALTTALDRVLRDVDGELWTGLVQFPSRTLLPNGVACGAPTILDEPPRPFNATRVLNQLRASTPEGGTPTYAGLSVARQYFRSTPALGRVRGRYLVLATDGGPNCNDRLSPATCVCTNPDPRGCTVRNGVYSCLDDDRTIALLGTINGEGYPTFVIGTPGSDVPRLGPTLEAMALAGGRAREGSPRYYRAEDVTEFTAAFRSITTALVRCRYVTNPISTPDRVTITLGGRPLPRDPSHRDGWDWDNPATGEIVLYGETCEGSIRTRGELLARIECADE